MLNLEISTSNEWHLLKGQEQFGPYTYEDMLRLKQNNTLFDFDYVWSPHMDQWTLVGDLAEFSVDRISRLNEKHQDSDVFTKRTRVRLNVELPLLCHNGGQLWNGQILSLSQGGAMILIENPLLLPGDEITLHVRAGMGMQSGFNCQAEVLNKRLTKSRIQHDSSLHYIVKFLDLTKVGTEQVAVLFKNNQK